MNSLSKKLRIAIVSLLVALPLFGTAHVGAQDQEFTPELYTSELSGFDVEASGPQYQITGAVMEHYQTGDGEIIDIEGEVATLEVSFFDDEDAPDDSIDAYLSGLDGAGIEYEELERDVDGDVTYSIVVITYGGTEMIYYVQVTEDITGNVDLFETILTGIDFFEEDLATAQEEVTIDGTPFMDTADIEGVLSVVEGGGSSSDDDESATPEDDDPTPDATTGVSVPFENAGVDLTVGGDFIVNEEVLTEGPVELYIVYTDIIAGVVALGETGDEPAFIVESYGNGYSETFDSAELVDSEDNGDSAWALYDVVSGGEAYAFVVYADTTTVDGYESLVTIEVPAADLGDSIEAMQDDIEIDGVTILGGVDASDFAGLVDDSDEIDADVTPEATEDDAAGTSDNPRDNAKLPGDAGSGNTSETNRPNDTTPEVAEPTEEPVGQSDSWTGLIYGNDVEWDSDIWSTDLEDPELTESDEEVGYEFVTLISEATEIETYLWVEFQSDSSTAEDFLKYWTSDEFLNHETSSGTFDGEILSSRSRGDSVGVVVRYTNDGGDFIMVREATNMADGSVLVVTIDAQMTEMGGAYESAQQTVQVNGETIFTVFSPGQVERLTGE